MKPIVSPADTQRGLLEARLRFWSTVPSATAMRARLEQEIAAMTKDDPPTRTSSEASAA